MLLPSQKTARLRRPFLRYEQDAFVKNYLASLQFMLQSAHFTAELRRVKLEELLLYLLQTNPDKLLSLKAFPGSDSDLQLRRAAEGNIGNAISLGELAFLCNCSLSTYKRRFQRLYGMPPQRWFIQEKMKMAGQLLRHPQETPGTVYQKVGYENHSSFTQAFKQYHGRTPSEYHELITA